MRKEKYEIWCLFVAESPKFPRLKGNRVGEHDGDVRCLTGSHGLVNSAMGQIPCSTERISCFNEFWRFTNMHKCACTYVCTELTGYQYYLRRRVINNTACIKEWPDHTNVNNIIDDIEHSYMLAVRHEFRRTV